MRKVTSLALAAVLQVLPLTRVFVATVPAAGSSFAIVSTWIAGALALMGGIDAVSGASSIAIGPTTGTVGVPYTGVVQYSGGHASSVRSWELRNNWTGAVSGCNNVYEIAPGLWLTNSVNYIARIGGTPTTAGTYNFTVRVWSGSSCGGGDNDSRSATITISAGTGGTAPAITTQPTSQAVTEGGSVSFSVAASGTAPFTYQWKKGTANVTGGTSATLSFNPVALSDAGTYTCTVSNSLGSATSSGATLTVNAAAVAPGITTQPVSQTVTAGANVSFTIAASGTAPLGYQWRLNGANISGATSATLSLTAVTVGQSGGSYTCVVSNSAGTATSSAATLTVNAAVIAPAITTQPVSQTVTAGANVSFTVAASGTAPLGYQWRLNGANISGATSATLSLTAVTVGQSGGSYTCVVSNSAGTATSSAATLTVNAAVIAPAITTQPVSQTVTAGANVSFTVAASGTAPLGYQWRLNGANISGATSATLSLTAVTVGQSGGSYTCVVSNSAGTATSSAATLTVNAAVIAPVITTQPVSQTVTAGANVSFTVAASGTAPLGYQWRLNGANISGATSATLSLTAVTVGQSGGSYTCVVSNSAGTATSSAATLTVNAAVIAPAITTQPVSQTVTAGANVSFTVAASGTAPLGYQWRLNGANISGATSATLSLTAVTVGQSGGSYTCVVSNSAGTATSSAATLTVNAAVIAPAITTQPVSQTVTAGANVSFTVAASGTAPLGYQWRLNGANISGATSATLSLTAVTVGQSGGSYTCVVSNSAGTATSSAATLTVNAAVIAPAITTQPVSQTVTAGANVSFTVAASGTAPLGYQWRLNGANISGATSATLSLTAVTVGQSGGSYTCVVSNSAGTATSSAATLTVNAAVIAPAITTQPVSQTVTAGANVSFTVAASGTAPLGYQWRLNGANISGATSATLSLTAVTVGQSGGSYTCVVSNSAGTATSSAATLTVTAAAVAPSIATQPVSQAVTAGNNVSFSVVATGTAPFSYQWLLNGLSISGATSSTLTLNSVTVGQSGGSYSVVVTNVAGSATSAAAILTVNAAPVAPAILLDPISQTVTAGTNVNFTVTATGTGPLSYQWRLNGVNISGATSATLSLNAVTTGQSGGSYSCFVTNVAGSALSGAAVLTVNPAPVAPTITLQPSSQTVVAGTNVSFTVAASGTSPMYYQWRLNGVNISGATSATLALTAVTTGQSGGSYSCVVSNSVGSTLSSSATLTVNAAPVAPTFTLQPIAQTVTAGTNVTLSVAASGTTPMSYQWRLNGGNISGATSATLNLTSVTTAQTGDYSCLVSNVAGTALSSTATLTVNAAPVAPTITVQPVSRTVAAGTNVSFTVAASGTAPMSYQWRLNGSNISGATSTTLTLTSVTTGQSGGYSCLISNAGGTALSLAATLTVNAAQAQPSRLTIVVQGQGTVVPDMNGMQLTIGQVYTLSALPSTGYTFSSWDQNYQLTSSAATISFTMTSNLVLTANFAADPLYAAAGTYNGLFYQTDEVRLPAAGAFNLRLDTVGNYSAWAQIGYSRYQFSGKLDANLQATSTVSRWDGTPLTVHLTVGQGGSLGQIVGSVSDGVWTANLSGGRNQASSPFAGDYTVVVPGTSGAAALPAGDGFATLHVAADGLGTMNGTLADGSAFAQTAYVTADGDWPLYVSLYAGKGAIVSWLTFTNLSNSDVSGDLVWIKQTGASATSFPLGFTNSSKAVGSIYVAPDAAGKAVNLSGAVTSFSGGSLAAAFNNVVSVNSGSQVVNLSANALTFTIVPGLGTFNGQVSEPGNGLTHKFCGVILQKQNAGYGTMVGSPNGSRVVLAAP